MSANSVFVAVNDFSFCHGQKYNFEIGMSFIPYHETAKLVIFFQWACYGVGFASLNFTFTTVLTCSVW